MLHGGSGSPTRRHIVASCAGGRAACARWLAALDDATWCEGTLTADSICARRLPQRAALRGTWGVVWWTTSSAAPARPRSGRWRS